MADNSSSTKSSAPQSKVLATALVFKLNRWVKELEQKSSLSDSEKRHLLAYKTLALVTEDRIKINKAKRQ